MDEVLINYFFVERKSGKRKRFVEYLSQHPTKKPTPISDDKIVRAKIPKTSNVNNYLNTLLKSFNQNAIKQNTFAKVCIADKNRAWLTAKQLIFQTSLKITDSVSTNSDSLSLEDGTSVNELINLSDTYSGDKTERQPKLQTYFNCRKTKCRQTDRNLVLKVFEKKELLITANEISLVLRII